MEATTAEAGASIKRGPHAGANRCCAYRALEIMGERFRPYTLGRAQTEFGLELRADESRLSHAPWPEASFSGSMANTVLAVVPKQLSVRTIMALCPSLFELDPHHTRRDCPHLDWTPPESRYCWLDVRPYRPYTARPQTPFGELPADFHTTVYIAVMGIKAGTRLFGAPVSVYDADRRNVVAVVRYLTYEHGTKLRLEAPAGQGQYSLYERMPCMYA